MISCTGGVAAHVVLTKYGWRKIPQSDLCSTLEWKAGFLNWCESGPWHNSLTLIQDSFYSTGWLCVAGGLAVRLLKLLSLQVQLNDILYSLQAPLEFTSHVDSFKSQPNTVAVQVYRLKPTCEYTDTAWRTVWWYHASRNRHPTYDLSGANM